MATNISEQDIERIFSGLVFNPDKHMFNLVYKFNCPGYGACYIGKTNRTLYERTKEHGWDDTILTFVRNLNI